MIAVAPQLLAAKRTVAVLLGASDWSLAGLPSSKGFRQSASELKAWLTGRGGLGLGKDDLLDYFDHPAPASQQLGQIGDELQRRLRERRDAGDKVDDLLVYYIGHGSTDDAGHLSLLVQQSRKGMERATGIRVVDLADILRACAPQQRRLIIFDCCYSEAAVRAFVGMSTHGDAVAKSAAKDLSIALPTRGGLFLGASATDKEARCLPDAPGTVFTSAFLRVVREGIEGGSPVFSFSELTTATVELIHEEHGAEAPRPVLHPINQKQGALSHLPAFRNPAFRKVAAASPVSTSGPAKTASAVGFPALALSENSPRAALEAAIAAGDIGAGYLLARALLADNPDVPAVDRAWELLQYAADRGHDAALFALGEICEYGQYDIKQDEVEALRCYRAAAERGSAAAQVRVAEAYEYGELGLEKDDHLAFAFYEDAAELGDVDGMIGLAFCYWSGTGVDEDFDAAIAILEDAVEAGSATAAYWLGYYLKREASTIDGASGEIARRDALRAKSFAAFELASRGGHKRAKMEIVACHEKGLGTPADPHKARMLLRKLADTGYYEALTELARYYEKGIGGLKPDLVNALRLLEESVCANDSFNSAHAALGRFYEFGLGGLEIDHAEAIRHYQKARYGEDVHLGLVRLGAAVNPGISPAWIGLLPNSASAYINPALHYKNWLALKDADFKP